MNTGTQRRFGFPSLRVGSLRSFNLALWLSFTAMSLTCVPVDDGPGNENGDDPSPTPARGLGLVVSDEEVELGSAVEPVFTGGQNPLSVDLSRFFPPAGDQGRQNSCVGWALGYALKTYQEGRERRWSISTPDHQFSPSYIYNRASGGNCSSGITFRQGLDLLFNEGYLTLSEAPYDPTRCAAFQTAASPSRARPHRIQSYQLIAARDLFTVKSFLAQGTPVLGGIEAYQQFQTLSGPNAAYDSTSGRLVGNHAVILVGYDDSREAFRLFNSFGRDWGDDGYAWIPYDMWREVVLIAYVAQDLVDDALSPSRDCRSDEDCTDGDLCTVDDCFNGECRYSPVDCDDDDACTTDQCSAFLGCRNIAVSCPPNQACDPETGDCSIEIDFCVADVDCDNGFFCDGAETCNSVSGFCVIGDSPCDNDQTCNEAEDTCDECGTGVGCQDDGLFCNGLESCQGGVCVSSGDPCSSEESCDEDSDSCMDTPTLDCLVAPPPPQSIQFNSGETLTGIIANASSSVVFVFPADAGDLVRILVARLSGALRPNLTLFPPCSATAQETIFALDATAILETEIMTTGLQTILLDDSNGSATGSFNITLINLSESLTSPNDTDGGFITPGATHAGRIESADMDAFVFDATGGQRVRIVVTRTSDEALRPRIRLYNMDGGSALSEGFALDTTAFVEHIFPQTGRYLFIVEDSDGANSGDYNATVQVF